MGARTFKDLDAYRLAVRLGDEIYRQVTTWAPFERWSVGMQLVRAVDSVGANIAEASGRWHHPDRRRLLFIARGSLRETEHWIERAAARGLLHEQAFGESLVRIEQTLAGLISRSRRSQ